MLGNVQLHTAERVAASKAPAKRPTSPHTVLGGAPPCSKGSIFGGEQMFSSLPGFAAWMHALIKLTASLDGLVGPTPCGRPSGRPSNGPAGNGTCACLAAASHACSAAQLIPAHRIANNIPEPLKGSGMLRS